MTSISIHLAVGMVCSAALAMTICIILKRGWRWLPLSMTVGGLWAIIPDVPALVRQGIPDVPLLNLLAHPALEHLLNQWGNVFFFHRSLEAQPGGYALVGTVLMMLLYNAGMIVLMKLERSQYSRLQKTYQARRAHRADARRLRLAQPADTDTPTAVSPRYEYVRSSHLSRSA